MDTMIPQRPLPSNEALKQFYLHKTLTEIPKPAAVLDLAIIKRHCNSMLQTIQTLGVGFRAHVKSHKRTHRRNPHPKSLLPTNDNNEKTTELSRLQVRTSSPEINYVASTVLEIESLVPLLKEFQSKGRKVNILYGIPLVPSQVSRLALAAAELGPDSVSVMIDHPDQIKFLDTFARIAGFAAGVFLKVDCGYHRAGLPPRAMDKGGLFSKLEELEKTGAGRLVGIYSHSSLSYGGRNRGDALRHLRGEVEACLLALDSYAGVLPVDRELVVSVGATPQVVAAEAVAEGGDAELEELRKFLKEPDTGAFKGRIRVELHAGNYPLLDMQQMSTNAGGVRERFFDEVGAYVVAETCSVYNDGEREYPEALVAVGTLGMGREPCPSYKGWGVVGPWGLPATQQGDRLYIDRISQEHSILRWESEEVAKKIPLSVGQTVKIYPNHACITGAMYGWYLVVDSSSDPDATKVVDVWVRWLGW
ncbi:putative serine dehydratase domain-containing protein [Aspergillus novoparasiticus]|uniref:Putative serine dehydratase domain-containing protein n=1 Tax=Aspergillus novoparasiticus TaxID=986946 RepID=A0A5N6F329_9EURO|nr:putative serine dehydratase domain-containing protein [Aspergillus novoparasiticus]